MERRRNELNTKNRNKARQAATQSFLMYCVVAGKVSPDDKIKTWVRDEYLYDGFESAVENVSNRLAGRQCNGVLTIQVEHTFEHPALSETVLDLLLPDLESAVENSIVGGSSDFHFSPKKTAKGQYELWICYRSFEKDVARKENLPETQENETLDKQRRQRWRKLELPKKLHGEILANLVEQVTNDSRDDYDSIRDGLSNLNDTFRESVARALEPILNQYIVKMTQSTYNDKKNLAKFVNAELRRFGLAICCPRTGNACTLRGDLGRQTDEGRFQLEYTDSNGKRHHPVNCADLPPLKLMLADLTRAEYGSRSPRSR